MVTDTDTALNAIDDLLVMKELDNTPMMEELGKTIDSLSTSRKAPGSDGLPPELIKCGKPSLL